jgi:hypothetical protein
MAKPNNLILSPVILAEEDLAVGGKKRVRFSTL